MWARHYDCCVICGRTEFEHVSKGRCNSCYQKEYKRDPKTKQRVSQQKKAWWYQFHEDNLLKSKLQREQAHYSGKRAAVLQRDRYRCTECGENKKTLVVHHIDGNGRNKKKPNNDMKNLVTLCKRCHIKVHRDGLYVSRRKCKI